GALAGQDPQLSITPALNPTSIAFLDSELTYALHRQSPQPTKPPDRGSHRWFGADAGRLLPDASPGGGQEIRLPGSQGSKRHSYLPAGRHRPPGNVRSQTV